MKLVVDFVDSEFEELLLLYEFFDVLDGFFERAEIISSSLVSPSMFKTLLMCHRIFGLLAY